MHENSRQQEMDWIAYEAKEPPKIPEKQHEVFLLGQHNDNIFFWVKR
jgi:hypothetical protein